MPLETQILACKSSSELIAVHYIAFLRRAELWEWSRPTHCKLPVENYRKRRRQTANPAQGERTAVTGLYYLLHAKFHTRLLHISCKKYTKHQDLIRICMLLVLRQYLLIPRVMLLLNEFLDGFQDSSLVQV